MSTENWIFSLLYFRRRKRKDSAIIEEDGPSDREEFLPGHATTDFNRKPKIGKITKIIAGLSLHSGRIMPLHASFINELSFDWHVYWYG